MFYVFLHGNQQTNSLQAATMCVLLKVQAAKLILLCDDSGRLHTRRAQAASACIQIVSGSGKDSGLVILNPGTCITIPVQWRQHPRTHTAHSNQCIVGSQRAELEDGHQTAALYFYCSASVYMLSVL